MLSALDIDIPLKYGVDQCVGDTICAGGIMYGQRTIPALLDICRDIREVAKPDALFLNYSNPMAMNTWACNKYGGVQTIGLCHGVQHGHEQIAECIELWARSDGLIAADERVTLDDVEIICAGINHQTWYVKVQWRGLDMLPRLLDLFEAHPVFPRRREGADRCPAALRLFLNRIQRAPQRICPLVSQTPGTKSTTGSA